MNAKDFLQAMNEIDRKYIEQADIFAPAAPVKTPVIFRALRWAGAAAACVLVAAGLWLMWDLGLLADINQVSSGQGTAESRDIRPSGPTPLSELPALEFPTRDEVGERGGEAVGCGTELTEASLTKKQIAAIWGQEGDLTWEGLPLSGSDAEYNIDGTAFYDMDGKLAYLSLEVTNKALAPECSFTVEIAPRHINALGSHMAGPPSRTCDVWGTEVTTLAGYNDSENFAGLSISFLTGPEGEEGTLGVTAKSMIWEGTCNGWTLEDGEELLTRLASQCLRSGNTFTLDGLMLLSELSDPAALDFPTREEAGDAQITEIGCDVLEGEEVPALSLEEIASIWGQEQLLPDGLDLDDVRGEARYFEGKLQQVRVSAFLKPLEGEDSVKIQIDIGRGNIPNLGAHITGGVSKTCDVWGTKVSTDVCYLKEQTLFSISFLTGPDGEKETLGVWAETSCSPGLEEAAKGLLSRLASQCLRPGNVFRISQLESDAVNPHKDILILKDGRLSFPNTDMGNFQAKLYQAFGGGPADTGSRVPSEYEGCKAIVHLTYPAIMGELLPRPTEDGEKTKVLCNLIKADCGFYEKDGEKHLTVISRSSDLVCAVCRREGGSLTVLEALYPSSENYAGSVLEFLEGNEKLLQELMSRQAAAGYPYEFFERLLLSYMKQNGMSGWEKLETEKAIEAAPPEEDNYKVRIDKDGYLTSNGYPSTFPGVSGFQEGRPAVLTGDDAVSNAADDSCVQVLNLDLPLVIVSRKEIEPAVGEHGRELYALYSVGYGFFERDGEKIIQEVTGYADVAGIITTPRGGAVNFNAWYPKDGTEYFPSIVEFIGGDESAAEEAVQQARDWPEKAKGYAEELLASYIEQNGMTGWKLRTTDKDQNNVLIPFGPEDGDLEGAAKVVAQEYADSWLSMSEPGYPPLAECFYTDLKWTESPDPDSDIQISCQMVFRLENPEGVLGNWSAGNTKPGTGEYEGYYTAFRFIYAKQENGRWVITGSGTGP